MKAKVFVLVLIVACGGMVLTPAPDATVDAPDDAAFSFPDDNEDGFAIIDASAPDEGCEPFVTKTCDAGCPSGTICARYQGGCPIPVGPTSVVDLGCVPIPTACAGEWSCGCMGSCACGYDYCYDRASTVFRQDSGLLCECTTTSLRSYKKDIEYLDQAQRTELAKEMSSESSMQRDVYGRLSAVLATAQEHEVQINALRDELVAIADAGHR